MIRITKCRDEKKHKKHKNRIRHLLREIIIHETLKNKVSNINTRPNHYQHMATSSAPAGFATTCSLTGSPSERAKSFCSLCSHIIYPYVLWLHQIWKVTVSLPLQSQERLPSVHSLGVLCLKSTLVILFPNFHPTFFGKYCKNRFGLTEFPTTFCRIVLDISQGVIACFSLSYSEKSKAKSCHFGLTSAKTMC